MKTVKTNKALYYLYIGIILGFVLLINFHANKRFTRLDLTENKMYTISDATKNLLKSLSDYVTIELYFSEDLPTPIQKIKDDVSDIVDEFSVYGGDYLKVEWKNPRPNSIDKQSAVSFGLEDVRLPVIEKDRQSIVRVFSGVVVRYADRVEAIPLVKETRTFEYELIKRISMVIRPQRPKVALMKTDPYTDYDLTKELYKEFFHVLEKEYDVEYLEISNNYNIDPEINTLIVPGGNDAFFANPYAIAAIDQFFMKGGKLIVLANKIDVNLQVKAFGEEQKSPLFALLEKYGVVVKPAIMADASSGSISMQDSVDGKMRTYPREYPLFVRLTEQGIMQGNPALTGFQGLLMPWSSPLALIDSLDSSIVVDTLIRTSDMAYPIEHPYSLDPRMIWKRKFEMAEEKEIVQSYPLALHLHGKFSSLYSGDTTSNATEIVRNVEENNLLVIGCANFVTGNKVGAIFLKNITDWFTSNDDLLTVKNRVLMDRSFKQSELMHDSGAAFRYRLLNITLFPILLIVGGLVLFMLRKKAQKSEVK